MKKDKKKAGSKALNLKKYNKEGLLSDMKALAVKLGRTPSARDLYNAGIASHSTYRLQFGSMTMAQREAGLEPNDALNKLPITREDCIADIKRIIKKLKRMPTGDELALHSRIPANTMARLVGRIKKISQIKQLRRLAYPA